MKKEATVPVEKIRTDTTPDGVLVLTMEAPERLNALSEEMVGELNAQVERLERDPELKTLVITGSGRGFCSGADVRRFPRDGSGPASAASPAGVVPELTPWERLDPVYTARETRSYRTGPAITTRLHNLAKPSFAAVNGIAYGLGCGMALACDFRIAAESARFNLGFVERGISPADGSTWRLPKLVGMSNALWLQFFGEAIDGAEAYRIGLANKVVPDDELLDFTLEAATKLARGPVYAMGIMKQLIHQGYQHDLSEHLPLASRGTDLTYKTFDHQEGVQAFLEKRQPRFQGR